MPKEKLFKKFKILLLILFVNNEIKESKNVANIVYIKEKIIM